MPELTDTQRQVIEAEIQAGNKIQAIKVYREAVPGSGLAEAKTAVDQMEAGLRQQHPERFAVAPRKAGCVGMVVGLLFLLCSLALVGSFLGK